MNNLPKLSVIIPTYNIEKYLVACLKSVVYQTYKNLEIIIIDDNSTDSTPEIIKSYAAKDKRIKAIFHTKNAGPGATRNEGLTMLATGDYITFVDHDDVQDLSRYAKMMSLAVKTNADITVSNAVNLDMSGIAIRNNFSVPEKFIGREVADISAWPDKDLFLTGNYVTPWAKIVKAELIRAGRIRFSEDNNRFDDILYHYGCIINADTIAFVDESLYSHRYFPESITAQSMRDRDRYFDLFKVWADLENYVSHRPYTGPAAFISNDVYIKQILICFLHELPWHMYFVKHSLSFFRKTKKIINKYGLKKSDFPDHLVYLYNSFRFWNPYKYYRRNVSLRIRPMKNQYQLILFGRQIFKIGA